MRLTEAYPLPLVRRLLEAWPELAEGLYPANGSAPEGYRGRRTQPVGGYEVAIEAAADLDLAVRRLDTTTARVVRRRYWEQRPPAPGEPRWNVLVELVWAAINHLEDRS